MVCLVFSVLSLTVMIWDCHVKILQILFLSCFLLCPGINCMFWLRFDSSPCASSLRSVPCGGSVPSLPRLLWGREARRPRRKLLSAVLPAWRHSFPADQWTQRRLALRPEPADGTVSDHQPFSQGQLNTSYASELNTHVSTMRSLFWEQGLYGLKYSKIFLLLEASLNPVHTKSKALQNYAFIWTRLCYFSIINILIQY